MRPYSKNELFSKSIKNNKSGTSAHLQATAMRRRTIFKSEYLHHIQNKVIPAQRSIGVYVFLVIFNEKWLNLLPGALAKNVMDKHIAFQALKQSLRLYD